MRWKSPALLLALSLRPLPAQAPQVRTVELPAPTTTLAHEFTRIVGVRELADGRVLVADGTEKQLLVADLKAGTALQLGRTGKGPGEYEQPTGLFATTGDSTMLLDLLNGRWLMLEGARIVATIPPSDPALAAGARNPVGADASGNVIITKGMGGNAMMGAARIDSVHLLRIARRDARADTVATILARKARVNIQGPRDAPTRVEISSNPLASGESPALFPDGWIAVARHGPYRVDWISPKGDVVRGKPLPFQEVKLDDRERREFLARLEARTGRPSRSPELYLDWPEIMPPFLGAALIPGPDGLLWIQRAATAANPKPPYDVVDRKGDLVAQVSVEQGVHVVGFGRGVLYSVETDADGIQRLQRRALPRLR